MRRSPVPFARRDGHVEASRATGSSPGRTYVLRRSLELEHHGLQPLTLGYEVHRRVGTDRTPVVVVGGISASRHLAPTPDDPSPGWWPALVGSGLALDPAHHTLIGIDFVGGPESPAPGRPITTRDQARAIVAVLDDQGIDSATVVGASYGGMVALALAAEHPERVRHAVVACAAHRSHPMATALRGIQRDIVRLAADGGRPEEGLVLARALGMTTYRSAVEFDERFQRGPTDDVQGERAFPVGAYLRARGDAFLGRFDADAFITLSESIDLHEVEPASIGAPTTLISVDSDSVVPPFLARELADGAPGVVTHEEIVSIYGHDAFLKEGARLGEIVRRVDGLWR